MRYVNVSTRLVSIEEDMSLRLNFIEEPSNFSNYIIHLDPIKGGKLAVGGYPFVSEYRRSAHIDKLLTLGVNVWVSLVENSETEKFGAYKKYVTDNSPKNMLPLFLHCPTLDRGISADPLLFNMVEEVYRLVREGKFVYVHCFGGHGRSGVFAVCFLMRYYNYDSETAIDKNRLMHLARVHHPHKPTPQGIRQYSQIRRYRPPITVIVSGDRNSANSFRLVILRALKDLPAGSTIVHGACKGIDTIAGEIANELDFNIKEYPILSEHWKKFGKGAGPIRNRDMLKENPKYVFVFHPNIIHSKGSKDMMMAAYRKGVPVWLYTLKDKKIFNGDMMQM